MLGWERHTGLGEGTGAVGRTLLGSGWVFPSSSIHPPLIIPDCISHIYHEEGHTADIANRLPPCPKVVTFSHTCAMVVSYMFRYWYPLHAHTKRTFRFASANH